MRSYQNNTCEVTGRGVVVVYPDLALIKTSTDNSCYQTDPCSENQSSQSLCTSGKRKVIYYCKQHPWGEEASYVASSFLGKCASITVVDLIQQKKLGFWKLL